MQLVQNMVRVFVARQTKCSDIAAHVVAM